MYEYFLAMFLLFVLWLIAILSLRKELKQAMIFTGMLYALVLIPILWTHKLILLIFDISPLYNPGYWNPNTLFNLNRITGIFSIEDVLFMVVFGGFVALVFEITYKKKTSKKTRYKKNYRPILVFLISYFLISFTKVNPIYLIIVPSFLGAISIFIQRKDLLKISISSGIIFTLIYFVAFLIFNFMFPEFIEQNYNLQAISNIYIATVPIEEILYALSLSLMWGPIYRTVKGLDDN